jgi:hypothetical protein
MKYTTAQFANQKLPLPADINEFVEKNIDEEFHCKTLNEQMIKWRENMPRRFGEISFMTKDGRRGCTIQYQSGIVIRYWMIKREQIEEGILEGKWSIMNDNIDPKTQKREKDGKNG